MMLLGMLLAALVGLSLGLLGGGGSILTVPIFVYVLGFGAKEAIGMSLGVVGTTSLVGAYGHWRAGRVDLRLAFLFGAVTMLGSFLGTRLATFLSGTMQLAIFALVMLASATLMLRDRQPAVSQAAMAASPLPLGRLALAGIGVGLLTGVVGVGGGFLIVPALVLLAGVPIKQAVGTSLLVIALNAAVAFAGYLNQITVAWETLLLFTAVAIGGIIAGTALVRFVSPHMLKRAFAVFLAMMGLFILYQNRAVVLT